MQPYGQFDSESYPLAAWIWGHRLREGQHWMEYLLEFLNVVAGFEYELGQGIQDGVPVPSLRQSYQKFTRLGLRRFIFYDEREKTPHPYDDLARKQLLESLQTQVAEGGRLLPQESLNLARSLFQAFTAVAAQRSWYAKSLFPVHHNLLFWEALRKGATKKTHTRAINVALDQVDVDISFSDRNFFARGGEIYYLILSAATEQDRDRRTRIGNNLRRLLQDHHQALGSLASLVDQSWQRMQTGESNGINPSTQQGKLGWIPSPQDPFYLVIAQDVDTLLQASLDSLELLDLLAHLICFHLTLYIYHHAYQAAPACWLIDALDGGDGGVIRRISAIGYKAAEAQIRQRAGDYVRAQVNTWWQQAPPNDKVVTLLGEAQRHFNLSKGKSRELTNVVYTLERDYQQGVSNQASIIEEFYGRLLDTLLDDFNDHFLGVHRKLAKAITFVAPRKGGNERFVLGDTLLKTLTLTNVSPNTSLTYDAFLQRLYQRYGLVVGAEQAQQAGLFAQQRINADSYRRNRNALLETMKRAGLAIEYSDATAMVQSGSTGAYRS